MAKTSGLGDALYIAGYDASGDIQQLGNIGGGPALLNMTGINKSAYERQGGLRSGQIEMTTFFNHDAVTPATHEKLSALPRTDVILTYCRGTTLGDPAASLVGKQVSYDPSRGDDGMLTFAVSAQSNGYGIEWGRQLTAGIRTDTAATNGASVAMPGTPFVQLPGSTGNTITTPDTAALDVAGDIDIRLRIAADDWTPGADAYLLSKYNITGNQRSYAVILASTGAMALQWSNDGTATMSKSSTANLSSLANGTPKWVRVTLDVDNGAGGNTVTFYTSDDGVMWTQLGSPVVTAGTTSLFPSTAVLEIGSRNSGTSDFFAGKFYEAVVMNGINGTTVAHPVAGASSVTDSTGLAWTVNGTATLSQATPYGAQAYLHVTAFAGADATVKIQDSADNVTFTDVPGLAFTQITSGPTSERIAISNTASIRRYVRASTVTTGGFTSLAFSVNFIKNENAAVVF